MAGMRWVKAAMMRLFSRLAASSASILSCIWAIRRSVRSAAGRTRLVVGRTLVHLGIEQHVHGAAVAFYGQRTAPYAAANGFRAYAELPRGLGHGRTPSGRARAVLPIHAPTV
jgi:hypothetical protein